MVSMLKQQKALTVLGNALFFAGKRNLSLVLASVVTRIHFLQWVGM